MFRIKGRPFSFKGVQNVEDCMTAEEVMIKSGMDWTVGKCPILADNEFGKVPFDNAFGIYRQDNGTPLGIVADRYTPVQNIEAFKFFDNAIGKDKAIWQTAGCFGNGERVFVSAKLPFNIDVFGDKIDNYLVFTTSHDGSTGVKILFTPIRVVCENTLNAAIHGSTNQVSFKHTKSVHDNISFANQILGISKNMAEDTELKFRRLTSIRMSNKEVDAYFAKLILSKDEYTVLNSSGYSATDLVNKSHVAIEDTGISARKMNIISDMKLYYLIGAGQKEWTGTAWGAYNAVTGYYSNVDNAEGEKRMDSLLYGDKSRKIETAGNMFYKLAA